MDAVVKMPNRLLQKMAYVIDADENLKRWVVESEERENFKAMMNRLLSAWMHWEAPE